MAARGRQWVGGAILLLAMVSMTLGARPKLVGSTVWAREDELVMNTRYSRASISLDFDQDLFLNEPTLCAHSETDCLVQPECQACDWSGQQPTGCDNVECCGPAQYGFPADAWCYGPTVWPYTTLNIGEPSGAIVVPKGRVEFFRFYLSQEDHCRNIQITVNAEYGTSNMYVSNLNPYPTSDSFQWSSVTSKFAFGQTSVTICPNIQYFYYNHGTYAIGLQAVENTLFTIEVHLSERYPLPEPDSSASCESFGYNSSAQSGPLCLEDGKSADRSYSPQLTSSYVDLLLPVPAGCRNISLVANSLDLISDANLFCIKVGEEGDAREDNSLVSRWRIGDDRIYLAACFEEATLVRCAAKIRLPGAISFMWSSTSSPIKRPIVATSPGAVSMLHGLSAAQAVQRGRDTFRSCNDYWYHCFNWLTFPTTDPIPYWPAPADVPKQDGFYQRFPIYESIEAGLAVPKSKSITMVAGLRVKNTILYDNIDEFLATSSIVISSITNFLGEPVDLPGGRGVAGYLPHIAVSDLTYVKDISRLCTASTLSVLAGLIADEVDKGVLGGVNVGQVQTSQLVIDNYNTMLAQRSCEVAAQSLMFSSVQPTVKYNQLLCAYDYDLQRDDWLQDPCCNEKLSAVQCCAPSTIIAETTVYSGVDDAAVQELCSNPDCAATFVQDLASAYNRAESPLNGCSFGFVNALKEINDIIQKVSDFSMLSCRMLAGLGDSWQGKKCVRDSDCTGLYSGTCDMSRNICNLGTLDEVDNAFLQCYIDRLDPQTESALRFQVLPFNASFYKKDSPEFFALFKAAASLPDCVNENDPFNFDHRTKFIWDGSSDQCKAAVLGLTLPQDKPLLDEQCPPHECLDTTCKFPTEQCYELCDVLLEPSFFLSAEQCPYLDLACTVDTTDCVGQFVCAYCRPGSSAPCVQIPGVLTQAECDSVVGCELPGGELRFDLTAEECTATATSCSVRCKVEPECSSYNDTVGSCTAAVPQYECESPQFRERTGSDSAFYGEPGRCFLTSVTSEEQCNQLNSDDPMYAIKWTDCAQYDVSKGCDHTTDEERQHMQCYVRTVRDCGSQQECESTGWCSDYEWTVITDTGSPPAPPITGACFSSGYRDAGLKRPYCPPQMDRPPIGCRESYITIPEECVFAITPEDDWLWRQWLTPASTKEECRQVSQARFGCLFSGNDLHLTWQNSSACMCDGGTPEYAWTWEDGVWVGGQVRQVSWVQAIPQPQYQIRAGSMSYFLLDQYLIGAYNFAYSLTLISETLCKANVGTRPLDSVVCNCFAEEETTQDTRVAKQSSATGEDEECFEVARSVQVGTFGGCAGAETAAKSPSAFFRFKNDSFIEDLVERDMLVAIYACGQANLSLIDEAWFIAPERQPKVSFSFQEKQAKGAVRNTNGDAVGTTIGDGAELSLDPVALVLYTEACFLINEYSSEEFPVYDVGYTTEEYDVIIPLGVADNVSITPIAGLDFLCGNLFIDMLPIVNTVKDNPTQGLVKLFPVIVIENQQEYHQSYLESSTEALVLTLGALFCFDLFLLVVFLALLARELLASSKGLPIVAYIAILFLILCIFRIAFLFIYVDGTFDDKPLAEFAVFEVPTFLLFTTVIMCLGFWQKIVIQKGFFQNSENLLFMLCALAIALVWIMYVIVLIVYSEAILTEETVSPCPGRVPASTESIDDQTRTLAVTYQSIIITCTFIFAIMFLSSTMNLVKKTKRMKKAQKFILRLGLIIVTSFMLRCIFFIVLLAADFTSAPYLFSVILATEVVPIFLTTLLFSLKYVEGSRRMLANMDLSTGRGSSTSNSVNGQTQEE